MYLPTVRMAKLAVIERGRKNGLRDVWGLGQAKTAVQRSVFGEVTIGFKMHLF